MSLENVINALNDPEKVVVAQVAPALRVTLGELFNMPAGTIVTKQMVCALKKAGFDFVYDTSFAADLVIAEEIDEAVKRMEMDSDYQIISSCCPAFVQFIQNKYPKLVDRIAFAKSPMIVLGTLIKAYFSEKKGIPKEKSFVVGLMPCSVKKIEAKNPELFLDGKPVVDEVLTTVETAELLKTLGIDLSGEEKFDELFGTASGGGQIFGLTGGVTEAIHRSLMVKGKKAFGKLEFEEVHEFEGVKETCEEYDFGEIKIATVNGIQSFYKLIESKKMKDYSFIEVMFCKGGCIGGPGQPNRDEKTIQKRREALQNIDRRTTLKESTSNPLIKKIYEEFLGKPNSEKAKKLLHRNLRYKK